MRIITACLLALGSMMIITSSAYAQSGSCGDSSQFLLLHARCFSAVCRGVVVVPSAASCTGPSTCDFFENITVDCCGFQTVTTEDVGPCGVAKLQDKHARRQLLALLKNNNILAPACGGAYVPAGSLLKR